MSVTSPPDLVFPAHQGYAAGGARTRHSFLEAGLRIPIGWQGEIVRVEYNEVVRQKTYVD
jgi:hypothetical protein